jgi:hypothetical protein
MGEDAFRLMPDIGHLAMHQFRRPDHLAAKGLADSLVAEADAQNGHLVLRLGDKVEADPGLIGRAGARRQHNCLGPCRENLADADLVVAMDHRLGAEITQEVIEVPGEAVVIVDEDDHEGNPPIAPLPLP